MNTDSKHDGPDEGVPPLSDKDLYWLHQLESVAVPPVLMPMRATEKLGKLGLIELRSSKLTLTDRGRQLIHRL
jgi:hypothetical protein